MSTAKDLLVIDASEHTYCPDPNDPHNPPRDVRDIREAMHPAESAGAVLDAFAHKLIDIGESGRAAVQGVVNEIAAKVMPGHEPPSPTWTLLQPGPSTAHVNRPYVATLPDGTRVNLPAGTVLREGHDDMVDDAADQFFDDVCKLIPWEKPDVPERREALRIVGDMAEQTRAVRGLLQRARIRLVDEPDAKKLDAEIAAFLAGASPPEHPVIALVRSFVGKPGDRGPVWGALMRLRERLDESGDLAAIDLGDELVNALNERLGQMHDALGRDTTEERTL